jgi:hypothetical protein
MVAKKGKVSLTLTRAKVESKESLRSAVLEQPTPNAQPVREVLEVLQGQAKDAMSSSVFDEGPTTEMTPIMKRMRSEIGSVEVTAKRHDPNLRASVAIEVRCDRNEGSDAGCYQVRADGHIVREDKEGRVEGNIPVSIEVNDTNGCLKLDSDEMRQDITSAICSTDELGSRWVGRSMR